MRKVFYTLTLITFLFAAKIRAQSLSPQVIASTGDYAVSGNYSLSSTTGEIVVQTLATSSGILTQGFQQPSYSYLAVENIHSSAFQLTVYPNPTQDNLFVKLSDQVSSQQFTIRLMDVIGRTVFETDSHSFFSETLMIPMKGFAAGAYLLSISNESKNISSYKIIKVQ